MRHGELKVWTEEWDGTPVVRADGEVDLATVHALRKAASDVVKLGAKKVIFDLRQVSYIDSSGLGVLVAARRHMGNVPGSVTVITGQPAVLQSLSLTGLDRVFDVQNEPHRAPTHPGP